MVCCTALYLLKLNPIMSQILEIQVFRGRNSLLGSLGEFEWFQGEMNGKEGEKKDSA